MNQRELLEALQDSQQYLGKLAADHEGSFLGRSAARALARNQKLINEGEIAGHGMAIGAAMSSGYLPNPYEIRGADYGRLIDIHEFGQVTRSDVGKRVYLRDGTLQMENNEQMERRLSE